VQCLLLRELRAAASARIAGCTDPGQVTADLEQRLRRIRELQQTLAAPPERAGPDGQAFEPGPAAASASPAAAG